MPPRQVGSSIAPAAHSSLPADPARGLAPPGAAPRATPVTAAGLPVAQGLSSAQTLAALGARLVHRLGPDKFQRYLAGALRLHEGRLDVHVSSAMQVGVYDKHFKAVLLEALAEVTGHPGAHVQFVVDHDAPRPPAALPASPVGAQPASASTPTLAPGSAPGSAPTSAPSAAPAGPPPRRRPAPLRYALPDFIVGPCNHVAHQAAIRLLEAHDALSSGSPLFISGPCGMGKTHLLQGLARAAGARLGAHLCKYITAEAFSHEFSGAVRTNKGETFRRTYRSLELLCIDDLDTLATKPKTQAELVQVIDAIRARGGRVAASGRDHPKRILGLHEALASRLCAGMIARMDFPDPGTLRRLLRTLAQRRGLLIDDAALEALAQASLRPGGASAHAVSVREIEGLLTKVQAVHSVLANLSGQSLDPARPIGVLSVNAALDRGSGPALLGRTSAPLLSPLTGKVLPRPIRIQSVMHLVCARLGVSEADLRGRSRQERLVLARTLTAHLAKRLTTMSYPEIARAMGRPNHSTIITACQRMTRQIEQGQSVAIMPGSPHEPLAGLCDRLADELLNEAVNS